MSALDRACIGLMWLMLIPLLIVGSQQIDEDNPRWNCSTMGNRVCGSPPPTTGWEDERWQDPSGLPYCLLVDDGMRPCIEAQGGEVRH